MSNGRNEKRWVGRVIGGVVLGLASICGPTPASASDERSSQEDLQRFVSVTQSLERAPLNPGLRDDREWALAWLTEAPDVTATLCADSLGGVVGSRYPYAGEIVLQNAFAMAVFVIEQPGSAGDPHAQQLAGVEGALDAYRSILRDKPQAKWPALDELLKTQSRGKLPAFIRKAWIRCSAKK